MTKLKRMLLALLFMAAVACLIIDPVLFILVAVHVLAVPATLYPLVYRDVEWKAGATGRALMNKALSLALLVDVAIVGYWWPFPGYDYIYGAFLGYLVVATTYQFNVMRKLRHEGKKVRA